MKHIRDNPQSNMGWQQEAKKSSVNYRSPQPAQKMTTEKTTLDNNALQFQRYVKESFDKLTASVSTLKNESAQHTESFKGVTAQLDGIRTRLASLDDKVERQELRLSAIESFPAAPISHPPRWFGTEAHSVSLAKRTRAGYLG